MGNTVAENEKILKNMANKDFTDELLALIRSRYPLIYLTTNEERRMLKYFSYLCKVYGWQAFVWDCFGGLVDIENRKEVVATDEIKNPDLIIEHIIKEVNQFDAKQITTLKNKGIRGYLYILLDYYRFLEDAAPDTERRIKSFANKESITTIIVTGPYYEVSPALDESFALLDFPYPNEEEIRSVLWSIANNNTMIQKIPDLPNQMKKQEDEVIKSAKGLTLLDVQSAFSKSLVINQGIHIPTILKEKKQKIKKSGILDYFESDLTIKDVGGLHNLIGWIKRRKKLFKNKSLEYGLKYPKALGLVGSPGGGKSLVCKVIANEYKIPLLKLDFGQVFQSYVGKSEERLRSCLKLAETIAPCIIGKTQIIVNNKRDKIKKYFDLFEKNTDNDISIFNDEKTGEEKQKIIYLNKNCDNYILGYKDNKNKNVKLKALIRTRKKEKLIKIKTKSGKVITITKDHILLDEKQREKKSKDFKMGDKISVVDSNSLQEDIIEEIEEIGFDGYVYDVSCESPYLYVTNDFISHNCCLWCDELEKGLSGLGSSDVSDGGTTSRIIGTFLTWLQEKTAPVFVIATINDQFKLPPELLRAGRFDEIFFIDLPNIEERKEIFIALLKRKKTKLNKIDLKNFDLDLLSGSCENYSGAEIEKIIDEAMVICVGEDYRALTMDDLLNSIPDVKCLYHMRKNELDAMREWAKGNCRFANVEPDRIISDNDDIIANIDLEVNR